MGKTTWGPGDPYDPDTADQALAWAIMQVLDYHRTYDRATDTFEDYALGTSDAAAILANLPDGWELRRLSPAEQAVRHYLGGAERP